MHILLARLPVSMHHLAAGSGIGACCARQVHAVGRSARGCWGCIACHSAWHASDTLAPARSQAVNKTERCWPGWCMQQEAVLQWLLSIASLTASLASLPAAAVASNSGTTVAEHDEHCAADVTTSKPPCCSSSKDPVLRCSKGACCTKQAASNPSSAEHNRLQWLSLIPCASTFGRGNTAPVLAQVCFPYVNPMLDKK